VLEAIREFFSRRITPTATDTRAGGAGVRQESVRLAACALLLELAHADGEFTAAEQRHIDEVLQRHFGLDDETAKALIGLADAERQASVDHFQFTHLITQAFDLGQRMVLAEAMWGVILADGRIAQHESYLVRKLARLLDLEPAYLAQARRAAAARA